MRQKCLAFGMSIGLVFAIVPSVFAVSPVSINQDADLPWSTIIDNPFDGKLVYDKHFTDNLAFVTSWSKQGLKATYTEYWSEVIYYRRVWRNRHGDRYSHQEPIYNKISRSKSPKAILFSVNGEIYTYTSGEVNRQLAEALANAPAGAMTVRAVWADDSTTDFPIGSSTVEAWKIVFKTKSERNSPK
jgi:hypothetical protein